MEYVSYDEFKKMDIRVGTIKEVEPVEETDKLLRFQIDFGEDLGVRQIVSGIHEYYPDYESLIGRQLLYIVNLESRTIRGAESNGMLLAVGEGDPIMLIPEEEVPAGSSVR
jgi:methionyl-tRNA synthetase